MRACTRGGLTPRVCRAAQLAIETPRRISPLSTYVLRPLLGVISSDHSGAARETTSFVERYDGIVTGDIDRIQAIEAPNHAPQQLPADAKSSILRHDLQKRYVGAQDTVGERVDESHTPITVEGKPDCVASAQDLPMHARTRMLWPPGKEAGQLRPEDLAHIVRVSDFHQLPRTFCLVGIRRRMSPRPNLSLGHHTADLGYDITSSDDPLEPRADLSRVAPNTAVAIRLQGHRPGYITVSRAQTCREHPFWVGSPAKEASFASSRTGPIPDTTPFENERQFDIENPLLNAAEVPLSYQIHEPLLELRVVKCR